MIKEHLKILIVDDEDSILKNLEFQIKIVNTIKPTRAANGLEAINILKKNSDFDLIICDYKMSPLNGLDVLAYVKENKLDISFVLLTAQIEKQMLIDSLNGHVFKIIEKPLKFDDFNSFFIEFNSFLKNKQKKEELSNLGEFFSILAHEINNPLTVMLMKCELVQSQLAKMEDSPLKEQTRQFSAYVEESSKKICKIINDVKNQYNSDYVKIEPVCMNLLIEQIKDYLNVFSRQSINFSIVNNCRSNTISLNKDQLLQIIINLINNSVDAISDLEQQNVEIRFSETKNNHVISVIDSGTGLSPEIQALLFTKNFSMKKNRMGTGLGLNICKKILNNYDASIVYNGKENTQFDIVIKKVELN